MYRRNVGVPAEPVGQTVKSGLLAVPVDKEPRGDVRQHREFEGLRDEPLQQVEDVSVHRADVHLC